MARTSAQLFAGAMAGETIDLKGEVIVGSNVDSVPDNVTIVNGSFTGQTQMFSAIGTIFNSCEFTDDSGVALQGLLRMLGGNSWKIMKSHFSGGKVASQLGVGLNSRLSGTGGVPRSWEITECNFEPLGAQWGQYPQGHHIYVLTDPNVNMGGLISKCTMTGSPFGAALKLGGTGNQPATEGTRGVLVVDSEIGGQLCPDGRVLAVLTQGAKTDVTLRNCMLKATEGLIPWVQGMDGARLRMEQTQLPQGVTEHATWTEYLVFKKDKKVTVPPGTKPPNLGGISWT